MLRKNYIDNKNLPAPIVFYCKDCEKIVLTKAVGRKFVYKCGICGTKNVAFGTEKSIVNYYRIEENEAPAKAEEGKEAEPAK
jgi:hypothetical protein